MLVPAGMAGVYDIAAHYQYETARGVEKLSPMARAMGGTACFPELSPSVLLQRQGSDGKCATRCGNHASHLQTCDH